MRRCPLTLALLTLAVFVRPAQPEDKPVNDKINTRIANFTLQDLNGKPVSLHDLKPPKAVVVVFLSFDCPVSNSYAQPLAELQRTYAAKGITFLGVAVAEDKAALAKQVKEFAIPFAVLRDPTFAAVDALKASTTPEVFVLDHNFVMRYRGRIDNGYYARLKKNPSVSRHDLREALDDLLAGKAVRQPVTPAVGCPLVRDKAVKKSGKVTYFRDVLPILQNHCQQCHRPGEVGPFALMTYKQAVNWADDIRDHTKSRKMPPWKPTAGLAFHNERKLSAKEIDTLAAWVAEGTPQGKPKDAPPPRTFVSGWQLGKPDLVLETGEMTVGASGRDLFRCFVLPSNLPEDRYVTAIEVRPGNPRVVHHTLNFIDVSGRGRELQQGAQKNKDAKAQDQGPGYSSKMGIGFRAQGGLAGWAPGQMARVLPDGYGYRLPKGADVIAQVHYHRTGRVEKDNTKIGLYFAKKPVARQFQSMVIPGRFLFIPAGNARHKVEGMIEVMQDCDLHTVMPHMHMLGKEIKVTLVPPKGPEQVLIELKDWDYNWQETYTLKKALPIKAGTRLKVEAVYDNSAGNPQNPYNPPRMVFFGEQTQNEMCFVFLGATSEQQGRLRFRPLNKDGTPLRRR